MFGLIVKYPSFVGAAADEGECEVKRVVLRRLECFGLWRGMTVSSTVRTAAVLRARWFAVKVPPPLRLIQDESTCRKMPFGVFHDSERIVKGASKLDQIQVMRNRPAIGLPAHHECTALTLEAQVT